MGKCQWNCIPKVSRLTKQSIFFDRFRQRNLRWLAGVTREDLQAFCSLHLAVFWKSWVDSIGTMFPAEAKPWNDGWWCSYQIWNNLKIFKAKSMIGTTTRRFVRGFARRKLGFCSNVDHFTSFHHCSQDLYLYCLYVRSLKVSFRNLFRCLK